MQSIVMIMMGKGWIEMHFEGGVDKIRYWVVCKV